MCFSASALSLTDDILGVRVERSARGMEGVTGLLLISRGKSEACETY